MIYFKCSYGLFLTNEIIWSTNNLDLNWVLGTPNYHGSYSGILKNALDHLTMDDFKMKPVGLIGNSGGIVSSEPLSHMWQWFRTYDTATITN